MATHLIFLTIRLFGAQSWSPALVIGVADLTAFAFGFAILCWNADSLILVNLLANWLLLVQSRTVSIGSTLEQGGEHLFSWLAGFLTTKDMQLAHLVGIAI